MTYKSPTDGSPVTRTVVFELRSDDEPFLLAVLADARAGAEPFSQRAVDRLADAIRHRKNGPTCNTRHPEESDDV